METEQKDTRTASQKISDLENVVMGLYQTVQNMTKDLAELKNNARLTNNKIASIIKASSSGEQVSDEVISRLMVENNVEELKLKVTNLVGQGVLESEQEVGEDSFVVGSELDESGTVVNPRLQFALKALSAELAEKIKGSKPGDVLNLEEGKMKLKVLETYKIVIPKDSENTGSESSENEESPATI
jgi:hypothetical protein